MKEAFGLLYLYGLNDVAENLIRTQHRQTESEFRSVLWMFDGDDESVSLLLIRIEYEI